MSQRHAVGPADRTASTRSPRGRTPPVYLSGSCRGWWRPRRRRSSRAAPVDPAIARRRHPQRTAIPGADTNDGGLWLGSLLPIVGTWVSGVVRRVGRRDSHLNERPRHLPDATYHFDGNARAYVPRLHILR